MRQISRFAEAEALCGPHPPGNSAGSGEFLMYVRRAAPNGEATIERPVNHLPHDSRTERRFREPQGVRRIGGSNSRAHGTPHA